MGSRLMTAVLVAALLIGSSGQAQAVGCTYPATFPGEAAAPAAIAAWMAARAAERGLPAELPVMAALALTGLSNRPIDRAGRAGYFGMLERLWGDGPYAGFEGDPSLQMEWILNQLIAVRDRAVFLGARHFGEQSSQWGAWIALALLVGRPAAYQARLAEARALVESGCATPSPTACVLLTSYPGDDASRVDIASWMANRAKEAGLPPELPIMAALVSSGLKNLQSGDADSVRVLPDADEHLEHGAVRRLPGQSGSPGQVVPRSGHRREGRAHRRGRRRLRHGPESLGRVDRGRGAAGGAAPRPISAPARRGPPARRARLRKRGVTPGHGRRAHATERRATSRSAE